MKQPETPIKTIIFDLGNVLVNFDAQKAVKRFALGCGTRVSKAWWHFFSSPHEKAYTRGEITCQDFYAAAKKALKLSIDFDAFRDYWNDMFWENEGMDDLLNELKKKYPLYLISNTNRMHFEYIKKNYPILRHFVKMFASHEVGALKPHPMIYQKVIEQIPFEAAECVFIDDKAAFIRGARKAGMKGIVFKTKAQLVEDLAKLGVFVESSAAR